PGAVLSTRHHAGITVAVPARLLDALAHAMTFDLRQEPRLTAACSPYAVRAEDPLECVTFCRAYSSRCSRGRPRTTDLGHRRLRYSRPWERSIASVPAGTGWTRSSTGSSKRATRSRPAPTPTRSSS